MRRPLHPFTILSFALFSFVVAVAGRRPVHCAMCCMLLAASFLVERKRKFWTKVLLYILPVAILLVVVNRFFGSTSYESVTYALRFVLLVTPLLIVVYSVPAGSMSLALRTANLPARLHYVFLFSLEMVTMLRAILQNVRVAQQLRGLRFETNALKRWKNILPMLSPVLLIAISQGLDRSLALDFKGIERSGAKTYLHTLPLARIDRFLLVSLGALACIVIASRLV